MITPSGCKDICTKKFEFVAKNLQFLYLIPRHLSFAECLMDTEGLVESLSDTIAIKFESILNIVHKTFLFLFLLFVSPLDFDFLLQSIL